MAKGTGQIRISLRWECKTQIYLPATIGWLQISFTKGGSDPDSMKSNFFNLSSRCLLPLQPNPTPRNPAPSPSLTHPGRSLFFFLDHFRQISFTPACSVSFPARICSIWSRDIRTKGFQCCWLDRSRNRCHCLEYMRRCCGVIHTGKRPRLAHASMI